MTNIEPEWVVRPTSTTAGTKMIDTTTDSAPFVISKEERTKGEWVEKMVFNAKEMEMIDEWQSAKCSVCGLYHTTPYLYYFSNYHFCPNCGADMRGKNGQA